MEEVGEEERCMHAEMYCCQKLLMRRILSVGMADPSMSAAQLMLTYELGRLVGIHRSCCRAQ